MKKRISALLLSVVLCLTLLSTAVFAADVVLIKLDGTVEGASGDKAVWVDGVLQGYYDFSNLSKEDIAAFKNWDKNGEVEVEVSADSKLPLQFEEKEEPPVDPDDEGKKPVAPTGPSGKPTDPDPTDPTDPEQPGTVTSIYTDIAGHWAVNNGAIQYVYDNKLMTGVTGTTFAPNATTTRAQIFVILARRAGVDTEGGSIWYQKGLDWMVANNYSDGTNPNNAITRQELAALLYRVIGAPEVTGDLAAYPDASAVSAWATNAMLWATQNGIITGTETGALNPAGNATRAEVATILMRFCQQYPVQPPVAE